MATLAQMLVAVRDQIDDVLSDVTDVKIHVEAGMFHAAELPSVNVYPAPPSVLDTGSLASFARQYGGWPLSIRVAVSPADISAGEELLWELMDDDESELSIIAALDSDRQLGGWAETLSWGEWAGYLEFGPADDPGQAIGSLLPISVVKAMS